jgi:hypothetical protein
MKEINCEEILWQTQIDYGTSDITREMILSAMRLACNQVIDLCAENIKGEIIHEDTGKFILKINLGEMNKLKDQIK